MADHDVPDSTDWLSTPLSGFTAVEAALRCQVCKDFFKTPMITSCSHTFCSLCIRRALSSDGKCPLCRAPEQELKLRSNWSMEETVEAFTKARSEALEVARRAAARAKSPKRKAREGEKGPTEHYDAPEPKRLRTSARLSKSRGDAAPTFDGWEEEGEEQQEVVTIPDDDDNNDDDAYVPEPDDGLVPCPVCQKRMKEWQVFKHLEACPGPEEPNSKRQPGSSKSEPTSSLQRQPNRAPERLPALSYSMYKDNALRKKMADLGLSNQGPRALLEKRHREWITLWNANCDAARPKRRGELLQDLDVWERTQGGRAPTTGRSVQNAAIIKDKDFDGAGWAAKYDNSFQDLIANARKSSLAAKKAPAPADEKQPDECPEAEMATEAARQGRASANATTASQIYPAEVAEPLIPESPPDQVTSSDTLVNGAALSIDRWDTAQTPPDRPPQEESWKGGQPNHEILVRSQSATDTHA